MDLSLRRPGRTLRTHRSPHRSHPRVTTRRLGGVAVALLLTASAIAACSGSGSDAGSDAGSSTEPALGEATGMTGPDAGPADAELAGRDAPQQPTATSDAASVADAIAETARSVIATGTVSLRAEDVEGARFDVQRVVDEHRGEIADEQTGTDHDGEVRRSRLVLRVPVAAFDEVMTAVSRVAELSSSTRSVDDVTTEVIDTEVRVRAQRKSLERIEALLARAEDLQAIVAIEAQLTSRQAELDSLEQQQAYLADQTSMATVTVLVERPADAVVQKVERAGFLIGLGDGWEALQRSTTALLTVTGAVLPFALLLALIALPGRLLLRRLSTRGAARGAARSSARTP